MLLHRLFLDELRAGRTDALAKADPADERDAVVTLLSIYELWIAPIERLHGTERFQNHPDVAGLKWRLEQDFFAQLTAWTPVSPPRSANIADAMRRIARGSDDSIYEWLATSASWNQLVRFLAFEGGPDGGFDDLVALCQIGLRGEAKLTLAANYWDEMGRGDATAVHTVLHNNLTEAIKLPTIPLDELPLSALYRSALGGLLATNRWLQPEMLGALGLLELQAGPRCRRVLRALERLDAPQGAFPFYAEHAEADPKHGKAWVDEALIPLIAERPEWAEGIARGARWRSVTNERFFADVRAGLNGERVGLSKPA